MSKNIIINSDETTVCPKCSHNFPLHQGITKQTIDRYEKEYDSSFEQRTQELKEELAIEATKNAEKSYKAKISELKGEIETSKEVLQDAESRIKKTREAALNKAQKDFEVDRQALQDELDEKDAALKDFRDKELELRKDKKKLEEDRQSFELELHRKLDEEKLEIEKKTARAEAEKFKYKEAEYKKKLESAKKVNEELTRKLEQGSQQLQGEVLELALEELLRSAFPLDYIEEVAKGTKGADVLQRVYSQTGQHCGTIIWEAKRAQNWSDKWIQKLKDDRLAVNADIAVIVSTTLPKDCNEPFSMIDDIWVVLDNVIRPVAETLRVMLIEANKLKLFNTGKSEKMELLYNYLCSTNFTQKVRSVIETFTSMKQDLDKEKNSMYRAWKKRESQLERVAVSMCSMVGELQAISQDSLPQLEEINQLLLPGNAETE